MLKGAVGHSARVANNDPVNADGQHIWQWIASQELAGNSGDSVPFTLDAQVLDSGQQVVSLTLVPEMVAPASPVTESNVRSVLSWPRASYS